MTDWVMKRSFPVPGGKVPWAARGCAVTISFFFGSVQDVVRQDKRSGPFRLRRSVPAPCTVRHAFFPTRTEKKEKKEREKRRKSGPTVRPEFFRVGGAGHGGWFFNLRAAACVGRHSGQHARVATRGSMQGSPLGAAMLPQHAWVATRAAPLELVAPVTMGLERAKAGQTA